MEKKKLTLKEIGKEKLIILFLTGVFLLILSFSDFSKTGEVASNETEAGTKGKESGEVLLKDENDLYIQNLENRLNDMLSQVEGIGKTKVMITLKSSKEKITLKDEPYTQENSNETDGDGGTRVKTSTTKEDETVLISNGNGDSYPYVVKETEPQIEGVLILAQGGGNGKIITEIVEAVQVLFNIPSHKIKVMKMEP